MNIQSSLAVIEIVRLISFTLLTFLICTIGAEDNVVKPKGDTPSTPESSGLKIYNAPLSAPLNETFIVRVREFGGVWGDLFTYSAAVNKDAMGHVSFVFFDSDFVKPIEMEIQLKKGSAINAFRVRPASAKVVSRLQENTLLINLARPSKFSVEINGDTLNNLIVFANPMEEKPIAGPSKGIHYFGPGVHYLGNDGKGMLSLEDGDTLYIAGGAIVYGNIKSEKAKNITIKGRGILCGSKFEHNIPDNEPRALLMWFGNVANLSIEGIILLDTIGWNITLSDCEKVNISNVKILSWPVNSDGINPVASNHVKIDDCFIRNYDDCFSIKLKYFKGAEKEIKGVNDIIIQNCILWSDKGRSCLIGPESSGKGPRTYEGIVFRNIDILKIRQYPIDWAMGVLAINCGDGATVKNVLFEDIRVDATPEPGNLINFCIVKTPFNGDFGWRIENIVVRNVSMSGANAENNRIIGIDDQKVIDGVHFYDLKINGKLILSAEDGKFEIKNAKNVTFETTSGTANKTPGETTKTPKESTKELIPEINSSRILFLGNSITRHAPLPSIGWLTDCGMAASKIEKDYVHLVASGVNKFAGKNPEIQFSNIAEFERNLKSFDLENKLKNDLDFKATLVIVALGENVPSLGSGEVKAQFKTSYTKLLTILKNNGNPTIIVRSCFWADKTKDDIMKEACISVGGIYIDIQELSKNESNYARSELKWENAGVGAHPGDKGMQAIADAILKALKKK